MWQSVKAGISSARRKESPLEAQLREATGKENWGVPNSMLVSIAQSTNDFESCDFVMNYIWKVLQEKKEKEWRRIQKALTLVEVILKYGSDRAIEEIKREQWRLQQWKEFRFMEEGKDVGAGIRHKVGVITELATDAEVLMEERDKAQSLSQKMTAVSSAGEVASGAGSNEGPSAFKSPFDRARKWKKAHTQEDGYSPSSPSSSSPMGLSRTPNTEAEANQMIKQFCNITNASKLSAKEYLERHQWEVMRAVTAYFSENGGPPAGSFGNAFSMPPKEKPGWIQQKSMTEQIIQVTKVTERHAQDLLERASWSVDAALDIYYNEQQAAPVQRRDPPARQAAPQIPVKRANSPSESSSGSEGSSSGSDEAPARNGKGAAGRGSGFTSSSGWPQDNKSGGWPNTGGASDDTSWPGGFGGAAAPTNSSWQQPSSNANRWPSDGAARGSGGGWPSNSPAVGSTTWPQGQSNAFSSPGPTNQPSPFGGQPNSWGTVGGSSSGASAFSGSRPPAPTYGDNAPFGSVGSGPFGGRGGQPPGNPFAGGSSGPPGGPFGSQASSTGFAGRGAPAPNAWGSGPPSSFGGQAHPQSMSASPFGGQQVANASWGGLAAQRSRSGGPSSYAGESSGGPGGPYASSASPFGAPSPFTGAGRGGPQMQGNPFGGAPGGFGSQAPWGTAGGSQFGNRF